MARYELACAAAGDLENIFEFGIDTFGLTQALDYMTGLKQRLRQIAEGPEVYPAIEHIRSGYRRSVYKSHSIYYQVESDYVFVVRVLGRQDIESALGN